MSRVSSEAPSQSVSVSFGGIRWKRLTGARPVRVQEAQINHRSRELGGTPCNYLFRVDTPSSACKRGLRGWGLGSTEGRTWLGSQVSRSGTWSGQTRTGPPHSAAAPADVVEGSPPSRAERWETHSVVHAAEKGPQAGGSPTSSRRRLGSAFRGNQNPNLGLAFFQALPESFNQSHPVSNCVVPLLRIKKLRYRGVW